MRRTAQLATDLPGVCRLGLATRGNTHLQAADVEYAIEHGLTYLNWCGKPDGMSRAIANLGRSRRDVVVAVQFQARSAEEAKREFEMLLKQLRTDFVDVATLYYVESEPEWQEIVAAGGPWEVLASHKRAGALKMIGLTSHQRRLAARWAGCKVPGLGGEEMTDGVQEGSRLSRGEAPGRYLDMLMVRYNAAHRGAEHDIFPVTRRLSMPVVTFTGLRWRALLRSTGHDPPGFSPPPAAQYYRFCLSNPDVSVALMAPDNREEIEENLTLLDDWSPLSAAERKQIESHGDRVRRYAGEFW